MHHLYSYGMCGIVGCVGAMAIEKTLLECLQKLEYRGYDSAGIAIHDSKKVCVTKEVGRVGALRNAIKQHNKKATLGIAHTRWATHGSPTKANAHPHTSTDNSIAIVHNGIIENYRELRKELSSQGIVFASETDTEVIAHLAFVLWDGALHSTMAKVVARLKGSYAIAMIHRDIPDTFVATRKDSPLVVGIASDGNYISSDITALLEHTRTMILLEENDIALITSSDVLVYNPSLVLMDRTPVNITWSADAAERGGFEHFMLKEIMEEPKVIRDTIRPRIRPDKSSVEFEEFCLTDEELAGIKKIFITACGTAYHAGMVAKYLFEHMVQIPVEVEFASEFRYRNPLVDESTLVIVISQSGETADTLAALREAKRRKARVLAIVNTLGSSIAREADDRIFTWAGPEIAVASTKAYVAQLAVIHLLVIHFSTRLNTMDSAAARSYIEQFEKIPDQLEQVLAQRTQMKSMAKKFAMGKDIFFIGRGFDYNIALEGSLKLKEISYIHSEAYAAGELKHGTIALIEQGTLVAALCTQSTMLEKMVGNIREVKARGAMVLGIACEGSAAIGSVCDFTLYIPKNLDILIPILAIVPLQLFAYYCAVERNCDVDKPRNLAKSVTVE